MADTWPGGVGDGAAVGARSLDIDEPQVLVLYPDERPGYQWHHRVLMLRLENSSWVVWTPDNDLYVDDLSYYQFVSVVRNSPFPNDVALYAYIFQQPPGSFLSLARTRAREVGRLLGADVDDREDCLWVVAEQLHAKFGEEVPDAAILDPAQVVTKRTRGIWDTNGEEVVIEYVKRADLDDFKQKQAGGGDLRVLSITRDRGGKRHKDYREAVNELEETEFKDFPHEGTRVVKEYLESIRDGAGNLTSYHAEFIRVSGLAENSAIAHDHKALTQALHYGLTYDQMNIANSAMAEQVVRRLIQHELAVERDPRHPDYGGLGLLLSGTTTATGSAEVSKFRAWLSTRQQQQAATLKQARLLREEKASESKRKKGDGKGKKGNQQQQKTGASGDTAGAENG
jgi:hypothetical protein